MALHHHGMVRIAGEVGDPEQGEDLEITSNENHPANMQRRLFHQLFKLIRVVLGREEPVKLT